MEAHRLRQTILVIIALGFALVLTGSANAQTVVSDFPELAVVSTQSGGSYTVYSGYWVTTTGLYAEDTTLTSGNHLQVARSFSYDGILIAVLLAILIALILVRDGYDVARQWLN